MNSDFNKNDKQINFNQVKGILKEINKKEKHSNIIIELGHENKRLVSMSVKNSYFEEVVNGKNIGDKVSVRFYLTSSVKENHWITKANVITIDVQDV
jgi:hypothetical protein